MTHPNREELAGRCETMADEFARVRPQIGSDGPTEALLRQAAAALRQSPSVEEVHDVILMNLYGPCDTISDERDAAIFDAARELADLFQGRGG